MKRRIWLVTVALLLVSLVLPLVGGVAAQEDTAVRPIVKFEGIVQSRPEDKIGTWVISGQRVEVVERTRFVEDKGPAVVGARVAVLARRLNTGQLEAILIRVLDPAEEVVIKIRGFITELGTDYLVVNGLRIEWNRSTHIIGELKVGAFAKIEALVTPSGLVAIRIEIVPVAVTPRIVEFAGVIESMGDENETTEGEIWVIAGREVLVTRRTVIIGRPAVGKWAEVRALVQTDQPLLALWIKVREEPEAVEWRGRIERLPPRLWGFWVVGGRTVLVTPHTEIIGEPQVGKFAKVEALRYPHRPLVAVKIEVLELTPALTPVPTAIPEPTAAP